jgi:hypothetical protein
MGVRHRVAAVAVSLPLILGVAACADVALDTGGGSKPAVTKPTAAPLKAAPPVRLTQANFLRATTDASVKAKSMESVLRSTSGGQVVTMRMAQTMKPFAMKMDLSSPAYGGAAHAVILKGTLYLAAPRVAPGGKYIKVNLRTAKDPELRAMADIMDSADPTKPLKGLKKVKFIKSETLGFRKVDRYQVTVDNATAFGLKGKLPAGMPKTGIYTVWLGADHLTYKMSFKMGNAEQQLTVSSYNTVDTITAPPASKIFRR